MSPLEEKIHHVFWVFGELYILFKEFFGPEEITEEDKEEDLLHEMEEKKK